MLVLLQSCPNLVSEFIADILEENLGPVHLCPRNGELTTKGFECCLTHRLVIIANGLLVGSFRLVH